LLDNNKGRTGNFSSGVGHAFWMRITKFWELCHNNERVKGRTRVCSKGAFCSTKAGKATKGCKSKKNSSSVQKQENQQRSTQK
jgi:hypothetical protein